MDYINNFSSWLTSKKVIFIFVVVGFIAYSNTLFNGFVMDDFPQIIQNQYVHSLEYVYKIFSGGTFSYGASGELSGSYYKPIMGTVFAIIYTIFGEKAFFFHLFQISIHVINSILVYLLFKMFIKKSVSLILSLIFLVHPINVEAVSYISALQDTLYFFFGMIAFFIAKNKPSIIKNTSIVFILLLSVLSKETGFLFLPIIVIYRFLLKKGKIMSFILLSVVPIICYFLLRLLVARVYFQKPELAPIAFLNLSERLFNIPGIILFYLRSFIFPKDFVAIHFEVYKSINFSNFFFPLMIDLLFVTIFLLMGIFIFKKYRQQLIYYLFFSFWFLLGIGLHLQIFPLDMTVADRWFYFPLVGLLGMIGVFVSNINIKNKFFTYFSAILIVLVIVLLSLRTIIRNSNYKDSLTLYSHDIKILKNDFELESLLGYELIQVGRYDEAKPHLEKSLALHVQEPVLNNLATIYVNEGDINKALVYFKRALALGGDEEVYQNVSYLLLNHKDIYEARSFIQDALRKFPLNPVLYLYLAKAENKIGNATEAQIAAQRCFNLSSDNRCGYYK